MEGTQNIESQCFFQAVKHLLGGVFLQAQQLKVPLQEKYDF